MLPVPAHRSDIIRILPASEVSSHREVDARRLYTAKGRDPSTNLDIRIEKVRLQQGRERHKYSSILRLLQFRI